MRRRGKQIGENEIGSNGSFETIENEIGNGGCYYSMEWLVSRLPSGEAFESICGFRLEDLRSYDKFVALMYRPTDPASLGIVRALFGLCMVIDVVEERGFSDIDLKWGEPTNCNFPLIHGMKPPSLPWTIVLYTAMWLGAWGIMFGFIFKLACCCFILPYWYFFLLDKTNWNNHSYLYGVVSILLLGTGANKYFSIDSILSKTEDASVPLWNYFILKFQFFVLYFLAGLKKSSQEWLDGYAMMNLSKHWVFDPFKFFLTTEQIDFLVVHWFGFLFDLTVGFWMLFDKTRFPAMIFCTSFHLMNSRLFHIGMFPYVCLATMPLFCHVDWPRKIRAWFLSRDKKPWHDEDCSQLYIDALAKHKLEAGCQSTQKLQDPETKDLAGLDNLASVGKNDEHAEDTSMNRETNGIGKTDHIREYDECNETDTKFLLSENENVSNSSHVRIRELENTRSDDRKKRRTVVTLLLLHVFMQLFLPYSHFITQGYNNWVPGLYGYSWDMMVHSWDTILVVIKIHDNVHDQDHFLDPQAWVQGDRWSKHGDMIRQYAFCLKDNLIAQRDLALASGRRRRPDDTKRWARISNNLSIYIDVWCSLNGRFLQRVFNPDVDLLTAEWHPFKPVSYLMPLLTEFSSYRNKLEAIQREVYTWSNYTDVLFVADYPGMQLENYIDNDLSNVTLTVLEGKVVYVENSWEKGLTIPKGDSHPVTPGKFHYVKTVSLHPACIMYTFTNRSKETLEAEGTIEPPPKPKEALPILKELKYKVNAWKRTLGHIADAFFYLVYNVPMLRRIHVD